MSWGIVSQLGLGLAGLAVSGSDYGDAMIGLGGVGASLMLLKYSRNDELEADRLGVLYMTKLGYDPKYAVAAHQNLGRISDEYMRSLGQKTQERSFFEELLSTHPRTSVRIDEIEQIIRATPPAVFTEDKANRAYFQNMTAGIRKANRTYVDYYDKAARALKKKNAAEATALLDRAITADKDQAPFYALEGFVFLKGKNYAEAERHFNDALALDRNYQPGLRGMGMLSYARSNYSDCIRHLNQSAALFPQDMASRYYLGLSHYQMRAYKAAIPHLSAFASAKPKHGTVHTILGDCYEKTNDLQSAYRQYAMQLQVAPNSDAGKAAAARSSVIKPILEKQQKK